MKKEYHKDEVLNIHNILYRRYQYYQYYSYIETLEKPEYIYSLIGIEIEMPFQSTKEYKLTHNFLNVFPSNCLKLNNRKYFFTLFNKDIDELELTILNYNQDYHLYIGMYICHPMIYIDDFIKNTEEQLLFCKNSQCIVSILNDLYYE